MRFGIMAMQIGSLIPPGLPAEGVLAHIVGFDHAALVRSLAGHGFNPIELGGDLALFIPQAFNPESVEGLRHAKADLSLTYTVHLPLWSVEPSTPLAPVQQGSARAVIDAIRATRALDPEVYVMHATGALAAEFYRMRLPEAARGLILRLFKGNAAQSLRTILSETGLPSRRLAIETIEFPIDLTLELAEELDLSLCLDTGHVLAGFAGRLDFFATLELCLPRLAEIHLHDCPDLTQTNEIGYGMDHRPLGQGGLDVGRLLDRLVEVGYHGLLVFELREEEALASLEVIRRLRPSVLT